MKKLFLVIAAMSCVCSCVSDVDWDYAGWSEVVNETSQSVTFEATYHIGMGDTITETENIKSGDTFKRYISKQGDFQSVHDAITVTIILADGQKIQCKNESSDSWSRRFYDNYENRNSAERSGFRRHEIIIETFHIDDTLIELWRKGQ